VGTAFFAEVGDWVDAGKGGQGSFQQVIRPLLRPITYDSSGIAAIWRPHNAVWINPRIQTGTPCIEGTRVPTAVLYRLVALGDDRDEVAEDYAISPEQLDAAIDFETSLRRAA
jgi:uncharacterized protein (DUF433 family)